MVPLLDNKPRKDMENFYKYFTDKNKTMDLKNQQITIEAAKSMKTNIKILDKLPKTHNWLLEKIQKQLGHRGCLRTRTIKSICDEILDPNNSSALLHYAKSPRKQGVEGIQREYVREKWGIEILAGKKYNFSPQGKNSYRLSKKGELLKGIKMNRDNHHKSFDGKILNESLLVFQKVTTDDGGSTNSVYTEVYETILSCKLYLSNNVNSQQRFIFLLDGPYWERKDSKYDIKNRFQKLEEHSNDKLFIVNSDNINKILNN